MKVQRNTSKEKIIIDAARKRFAHFGFNKVTMDEIATDVDMGKASLYYYFPTKENLFSKVVTEELNEFINEIEEIIDSSIDPIKKFTAYAEKRLEYFEQLLNLGTLNVHSYKENKWIYRDLFKNFEKRETALIKKILNEGIDKNVFNKNICKNSADVIIHLFHGMRLRALREVDNFSIPEETLQELKRENKVTIKIILEGISAK